MTDQSVNKNLRIRKYNNNNFFRKKIIIYCFYNYHEINIRQEWIKFSCIGCGERKEMVQHEFKSDIIQGNLIFKNDMVI